MSCTPTLSQDAYRLRNDNGNETTATWLYNENVSGAVAYDTNFRIRFLAQVTNACAATNRVFQLQYSLNGGTWTDVTASSAVIRSSASPNLADAANLTDQMTAGSGTFIGTTGFDEVDGAAGGNSLDIAASGQAQVEYCVQIRSVDVTTGGSVQLRITDTQANLATWNQTPTLPLAPITPVLTDPWANLNDTNGVTFDRTVQLTPLTPTIPADPWENLADSHVIERYWDTLSDSAVYDRQDVAAGPTPKNYPLSNDPWENLADAPPTVFRTGALAIALSADPWGNLSDSPPTVAQTGTLTLAPSADPMTMGDTPPTVAMTGARAIALSADPWANLADSPPTISQGGTLALTPPADALNLWSDSPPTITATGAYAFQLTGDSMSLGDLTPTIAAGGGLIVTPPADTLANYADTLATERSWERLADSVVYNLATLSDFAFSLTDTLDNWADTVDGQRCRPRWNDSLTVIEQYIKQAVPTADNLANYAERLGMGLTLAGDTMSLADLTPTIDKQDVASTPKTAAPPADAWQNLSDSPPTILRTGALTAQPTADPWQNLSDSPPTVAMTGTYALLLTGDAMTLADQPPTVAMTGKIQIVLAADPMVMGDLTPTVAAGGDLFYVLPSDSLASYADALGQSESYRLAADDLRNYDDEIDNLILAKRYPLSADPWANLGDSPPTIAKPGSLTIAPPANAMTMADTPPTIIKTALKAPSLPADAMTMGDRLGVALGLADPWETLNDAMRLGWAFKLTGDAMSYADEMQLAAGGDLPFSLPADPMTLADQWAVTYGESYQPTADAMSMGDQPVAYAAGILLSFSDDLDDWQDSRETVEGLAPQLTDDLNEYLDEMRIRGIIPAEIIRLSGKQNTSVGLSGKVIDKVGLSGHVKGNRIGVSGKLYEGG